MLKYRRRVVLVHPFDAFGGAQRVAATLARALADLSFDLHVYLGFGSVGFVSEIGGVRRFWGLDNVFLRKIFYPLWLIAFAPRMLMSAIRGELVWANTVNAIPAVLPMLVLRPRSVIIHVHEIEFAKVTSLLLNWAVRRGAVVLCVSNLHRERLAIPCRVLLNCVDHASESIATRPPILVFVGALSKLKGFPLFLDVVRRIPLGRVRAVAYVPSLPASANALVSDARAAGIDIRTGISRCEEMFDGASLLLQCTDPTIWTETFSLVMVEALACGVPVATAGMAVAPEILGDAQAFDVPSRNPDRIAEKVLALLGDPIQLESLRIAAKRRRQVYSFDAFKSQVSDVVHGFA